MEQNKLRLGCVIMAAGNARRFGNNKLAAELDGKTLAQRALESVPSEQFAMVAVVTQYPEIEALAAEFGFRPIRNEHPDWGISHTISLGLDAVGDCDAALFQVSDQPLLQRNSVAAVVEAYLRSPDKIVSLAHNGVRGNPCLFPERFFPELRALTEDRGGNTVIRAHEEDLLLVEAAKAELMDVDSPEALRELTNR